MRKEKDQLGELMLADELYGIHTKRALQNFPSSGEKVNPYLIKYYLLVKKACAVTNHKLKLLGHEKYALIMDALDTLLEKVSEKITNDTNDIYRLIPVDPYQGGAGTSLNMNINEVISNLALIKGGFLPGQYEIIHPIDDINLNQSTNDTFPTAFKAASIALLRELQEAFSNLQKDLQDKETQFAGILKLGRTQLQDGVPMTLGQEFGAYAQAIARDRWRFYNAEERLRSVNLGGTAIGNSIAANSSFVSLVMNELRALTGLPLARAEDLIENTQNLDIVVEVHGIIKAGAVSIQKLCNDLRLLSSGPYGGIGEIILPEKQAGSSIMPGKINPVILEHAFQTAELVKGHDVMIANLVSAGNLELQQYMPMIAHLFLKTAVMLRNMVNNLSKNCIRGIQANEQRCLMNLLNSTAIATAFIPEFGYDRISAIVKNYSHSKGNFSKHLQKELNIPEKKVLETIARETGVDIERYTTS